jgi:Na+/melibiose symporter-like transporter
MRLCFSIIPAAGCLLALAAIRNWPLTRARCEEIQSLLVKKREAAMSAKP